MVQYPEASGDGPEPEAASGLVSQGNPLGLHVA
jgi:hypothetical protein